MRRVFHTSTVRLLGIVAASTLVACTSPSPAVPTIVLASGADLESGNPLVTVHPMARQIQRYVLFVTLARYDSALAPSPYFARSWAWSADRTSLTLTLFSGLRWHDGVATTASDVVFTLNAARDERVGYHRASDLGAIRSLAAPNDSTVVIEFVAPQPRFPLVLCELPIVPEHLLADVPRDGWRRHLFATAPVGNGPWQFTERRAGQRWVFTRNMTFPPELGGPPSIERVVVAVVDEATTKYAGLVAGDLDLAGISPVMASLAAGDSMLRVIDYPVTFSTALVFNLKKAPLDDVRVRRAIGLALNRERIVDFALAGYGRPAHGAIPPEHPWSVGRAAALTDSRHAADSLLTAAGWLREGQEVRARSGNTLRLTLRSVGSGENSIEQLIQADLRSIGIDLRIEQMELGALLADARSPDRTFDVLFTGIPGDLSLSHISAMFETAQQGGALDYAGFHDTRLDALFVAARSARSDSALVQLWQQIELLLGEESPVAWIYHARGVQGVLRRVEGVEMDLRGELEGIARWSIRR